jgi:hypothetical protein
MRPVSNLTPWTPSFRRKVVDLNPGFIVLKVLYVTQLDNWLKIKVVKGKVLQVVESPAKKALPFGSRLIFKGLERNGFALFEQPLPGSQGPHAESDKTKMSVLILLAKFTRQLSK